MFHFFQPLNHLLPIREWARTYRAKVHLSIETFTLRIQVNENTIILQPRFVIKNNDVLAYRNIFEKGGAFVGWVQENTRSWPAASEKIEFKKAAVQYGLRIPSAWNTGNFLSDDYLIKTRRESFGRGIRGPYRVQRGKISLNSSAEYYEQFILGKSAKAWCWNQQIVAIEVVERPYICADGKRPLSEIASTVRGSMDKHISLASSEDILAWQGVDMTSVPDEGTKIWLDFKYATPFDIPNFSDRNSWNELPPTIRHQFSKAAALLNETIPLEFRNRVMYTLDAVIDDHDRAWFLEMNSHPMVHPNIYAPMLTDIFSR